MIKKILLVSALAISVCGIANADSNNKTISFNEQSSANIVSNTSLVEIIVNTTSLGGDQVSIENKSIDFLKKNLANVDLHINSVNQSKSASGALNLTINIQVRLTQNQIAHMNNIIKSRNFNNTSYKIKVLNNLPTKEVMKKAKRDLMLKMYSSIDSYLKRLNTVTHQKYKLQKIGFYSSFRSMPNVFRGYSLASTANIFQNKITSKNKPNITTSNKLTMTASIIFAEK